MRPRTPRPLSAKARLLLLDMAFCCGAVYHKSLAATKLRRLQDAAAYAAVGCARAARAAGGCRQPPAPRRWGLRPRPHNECWCVCYAGGAYLMANRHRIVRRKACAYGADAGTAFPVGRASCAPSHHWGELEALRPVTRVAQKHVMVCAARHARTALTLAQPFP